MGALVIVCIPRTGFSLWLCLPWQVLRNDAGYFAQGVYAEEAKRLGAELRAPCVQEGAVEHELIKPTVIRVGLSSVHGLGQRTISATLAARRAGGGEAQALEIVAVNERGRRLRLRSRTDLSSTRRRSASGVGRRAGSGVDAQGNPGWDGRN